MAGLAASEGILTALGGRTSHAAVVARQMNKVCIVGCRDLVIERNRRCGIGRESLAERDFSSLDAIVDSYFPLLEGFSDHLEDVEERLLTDPDRSVLQQVHTTKRELLLFRRAVWPLRELIAQLQRDNHECLSETAQTYLRDVFYAFWVICVVMAGGMLLWFRRRGWL